MVLMKCIECYKTMSDTLDVCPHCGFKRIIIFKMNFIKEVSYVEL